MTDRRRCSAAGRLLGLSLLCLFGSCTCEETRQSSGSQAPPSIAPHAVETDWTVGGVGGPADGPGERCEQLTGTCAAYCTEREHSVVLGDPPALSGQQVTQLGLAVFRQTLAKRASWLLIDPTSRPGTPAIEADVLRRLEQQYQVFQREEELPAEYVRRQGSWVGYEQGYRFRYQLDFLASSRVRVWVKSTYGNWGCDFYYDVYKWEGDEWRVACVSPTFDDC